jgi:hypothetical protein
MTALNPLNPLVMLLPSPLYIRDFFHGIWDITLSRSDLRFCTPELSLCSTP